MADKSQDSVGIETHNKSGKFKNFIIRNIIQPEYTYDLQDKIKWRRHWHKISSILHSIAKLFALLSGLISFIESYFKLGYLSLIAGSISVSAALLAQYGDFANKQALKRTYEADAILGKIGIDELPELYDNTDKNISVKESNNSKPIHNSPEIIIDVNQLENKTPKENNENV